VRTETGGDGSQRVVVEVPGVDNPEQVRRLVGSTGQLQFVDPQGQTLTEDQDISQLIEGGSVGVLFDGGEIEVGSVAPAVDGNLIGVQFSLSDRASDIWCSFTSANVNRPGPIALDGNVITTPTINGPICGGQTIITVGAQSQANELERTELYNTLRFGALPISLTEQGVETVDPTLGTNFLVQALVAGGVGLALVLIFMVAYYRLPGILAAIALIVYTLVVYAVFRTIHVTLTLAGVAAFILSIGMAVDANILIFERMKEEIRAGKTLGPAIEAGFNRAWSSILDSNVASLLVAGWLYWQGTTVVRGFALVLIIGVLVSMFSAVTVTRTLLRYVTRTSWGRRLELYHVER
jgi:preprotein translocase subunit SecD